MRIAPKLQIGNPFHLERQEQKILHWHSSDWISALDRNDWPLIARILHDRLYGRFLRFIPKIEAMEGVGFAIMALDCLLIETLFQFQHGWLKTPSGCADEVFNGFLLNQIAGFDKKTVKCFREKIRNGLLHAAEIYGDSLIVNKKLDPIVEETGDGITINRTQFHKKLVARFNVYIGILSGTCPAESDVVQELRERAKLKIQNICRLKYLYFNYDPEYHSSKQGRLFNWKFEEVENGNGKRKYKAIQEEGHILEGQPQEIPSEERSYDSANKSGYLLPILIENADGNLAWAQMYMGSKAAKSITEDWAKKLGQAISNASTD